MICFLNLYGLFYMFSHHVPYTYPVIPISTSIFKIDSFIRQTTIPSSKDRKATEEGRKSVSFAKKEKGNAINLLTPSFTLLLLHHIMLLTHRGQELGQHKQGGSQGNFSPPHSFVQFSERKLNKFKLIDENKLSLLLECFHQLAFFYYSSQSDISFIYIIIYGSKVQTLNQIKVLHVVLCSCF